MKSVLVTGGTIRLGAAIAERLRADGWRVLTSSHRADAGADIVADLSEPMGAAKLYAAALRILGGRPPDALVNNAALFTGDDAAIAAVNFEAPKKLTMMMAGREEGVGAVVNILDSVVLGSIGSTGSVASMDAGGTLIDARASNHPYLDSKPPYLDFNQPSLAFNQPSLGSKRPSLDANQLPLDFKRPSLGSKRPSLDFKRPYLDSKRELAAFTLSSAMMFAATLRVNGVAPGPVLAPTDVHEKAGETLLDRRPTPEDVAAAVAYLLGAEAVTGTVVPVDAGQHLVV